MIAVDYTNKVFRDKPKNYVWYSIRTFDKQESKAVDNFLHYLKNRNLQDHLLEIFMPKQKVISVKRQKQVTEEYNFYPGHVFICIDATNGDISAELSQFLLKKGKTPCKFTQSEIDKIKEKVSESHDKPTTSIDFGVNSRVRIISGLYTDMKGIVEKINFNDSTVIVKLDIFGGSIPAEVSLLNITNDE